MRRALPLLALLLGACPARTTPTPDEMYRACEDAARADPDHQCVYGLAVPRCGAGDACVEGRVCHEGTCSDACDATHACTQAFSCVDGACKRDPCGHASFWPLSIASEDLPAVVHFRHEVERAMATEVLGILETAWRTETGPLGWDPPLSDGGACGGDARFDVFLWRSYRGGVSDVVGPNLETPWDDDANYFVLDPWGPYGGPQLRATIAHELNHALQAVHDWNELPAAFEMTAMFIEDQVFDDANTYLGYLADFQARPEWALDHDDGYESWFMYGSALYLMYLRDAVFHGDARFASEVWRRARSEPGHNDPDLLDALDAVLREHGSSLENSLLGFARWRWFTGARDDGRHFEEGALFPAEALVRTERAASEGELEARLEVLGTAYVPLVCSANDGSVSVRFEGDPRVRWVLQAVPGVGAGSDGDAVALSAGSASVPCTVDRTRVLVVSALPLDAAGYDPAARPSGVFAFRVQASVGTR